MQKLSIVTTLYQSEAYVREFYERTRAVVADISDDYEIIFVNDGSPDGAIDVALGLREADNRVTVIDLSRNFGHHRALMVGLEFAVGDLIFMIDVDLEEDPDLLRIFYARYQETRADSVFGVQRQRKGGRFEQLSGALYYQIFNFLSGYDAPKNTLVARLMTRRFLDSLLLHKERDIDIAGLLHLTGFSQLPVYVDKRAKPETTYTLRRKLVLAFVAITSFSRRPLIMVFLLGSVILLATTSVVAFFVFAYLYFGTVPSGFTSIILSLWFLGGLTIFSVGLVALYLSVLFNEVKARPAAIVRAIYRSGTDDDTAARTRSGSGRKIFQHQNHASRGSSHRC